MKFNPIKSLSMCFLFSCAVFFNSCKKRDDTIKPSFYIEYEKEQKAKKQNAKNKNAKPNTANQNM